MKIFLVFAVILVILLALILAVASSMPSKFYDDFFNKRNENEE